MNLGVTIASKGKTWEVVSDPNVPFATQRRDFFDVCKRLEKTHDEVQLLSTSSGRVRKKRLKVKSGVASLEVLMGKPVTSVKNPTSKAPVKGAKDDNLI